MNDNILGVDIGGVIISRITENEDTSFFSSNYLNTPPVSNSFEALKQLNQHFSREIHLVSKCGHSVQAKTLKWLDHWQFENKTGIPKANVHFCLTRPEKSPICKRFGVTCFVDDRLDVLEYLKSVRRKYLFQPRAYDLEKSNCTAIADLKVVNSWSEIVADLINS